MAERQLKPRYERSGFRHFILVDVATAASTRTEIHGKENLETVRGLIKNKKPTLVIANHLSHADATVLDKALSNSGYGDLAEDLYDVAGDVLVRHPVLRHFIRAVNYIPVPSQRVNNETDDVRRQRVRICLDTCGDVMDEGKLPIIFAEGTRSRTGSMRRVRRGIAMYFDLRQDTFVVPVGIWGTEKVLPSDTHIPIPRPHGTNIRFGRPTPIAELRTRINPVGGDPSQMLVDEVMYEVAALLPEKYRGVYGSDILPVLPIKPVSEQEIYL